MSDVVADLPLEEVLDIDLPDFDEEIETHRGLKRYVQLLANAWFRTPARIAGTCLLVLGCLGLIGWNLTRLTVIDELVDMEIAEFALENQLSDLEIAVSAVDNQAMAAAIEAENDRIFQGFPELAAWTQSLSGIALNKGVALNYRIEKPHFSAVPGILEVPVMLEFKARASAADKLFAGSMQLLGVVLRDHWHIDVISTYGRGNGQQLEQISVRAQVWVRDRFGFVDMSELVATVDDDEFEDDEFEDDDTDSDFEDI